MTATRIYIKFEPEDFPVGLFAKLKIIISILLILSLAVPFGGSFILLQFQKQLIKKEIKNRIISGIDRNDLVILKFTKTESESKLKWKESKEFEYNGEMYDVVESEFSGDTITYWCWWDREETRLNRQLNDLADRAAEQNTWNEENLRRITTFLQSLYSPSRFDFDAFANFRFAPRPTLNYFYSSICIPPPIPPP